MATTFDAKASRLVFSLTTNAFRSKPNTNNVCMKVFCLWIKKSPQFARNYSLFFIRLA